MKTAEVKEILVEGISYIDRVINNLVSINRSYYIGQLDEAVKYLDEFIEGINWLEQVVVYIEATRTDEQKQQITEFVEALNEAIKNGDWISVLDLMEYEVEDILMIYKALLTTRLEQIEREN